MSRSQSAPQTTREDLIKEIGLKAGAKVVGIAAASAFNEYVPVVTPPGGLSSGSEKCDRCRGHRAYRGSLALSRSPSDGDHWIRFPGECGGACHG